MDWDDQDDGFVDKLRLRLRERRPVPMRNRRTAIPGAMFFSCESAENGEVKVIHRAQREFRASAIMATDFDIGLEEVHPLVALYWRRDTLVEGDPGEVPRAVPDLEGAVRRLREVEAGEVSLLDYAARAPGDVRALLAALAPPPGSISEVRAVYSGCDTWPGFPAETASLRDWVPVAPKTVERGLDLVFFVRFRRPGRWCAVLRGEVL